MSDIIGTEEKKFRNLDWTIARTVSLSIAIGIMAAFAAKGLLIAINLTQTYLHKTPLDTLVMEQGIENATLPIWSIGVLAFLGLIVGLLTHYLMPNRANRGLSHVIEDIHFNQGQTGVREGLAVGLISAVSIGAGVKAEQQAIRLLCSKRQRCQEQQKKWYPQRHLRGVSSNGF